MPFLNNNVAVGIPAENQFKVGRSDVDPDGIGTVEQSVLVPWASDPAASWVYYECAIGAMLDSGIVVHHRLPQVDNAADTLASCSVDDPNLDRLTGNGVNLRCRDQYQDIVQRMGHARYWFRLWGQALRIGYQVPIPGLVRVGGQPAIPYDKNPQWAYCSMAPGGNYSGVILWRAQWSLWYTTSAPPVGTQPLQAIDASAHIQSTARPPVKGVQSPFSQPDDNARPSAPGLVQGVPIR